MTKIINGRDFQNLELEEQSRIIFSQPLPDRAELITLSNNPRKILSSLSSEELLFITRSTDRQGVMELAEYANSDQLVFLTDYNCWDNDSVDHEHFIHWMSDLLEIGLEKFTGTIKKLDYELLVAAFKYCVEIIKTQHEEVIDEIVGDDPYFTLDNLYYVRVMNEDNFRTVKTALEVIYSEEKALYFEILEGILSETDSQIEEEAFELREERLAEHGFPPKEESFRIYKPLSAESFTEREKKNLAEETGVENTQEIKAVDTDNPMHFPAFWEREGSLFDQTLALLAASPREHIEHISKELIWLINKTIVCSGGKIDPKTIRESASQARAFVSLGLDVLSSGNTQKCKALLLNYWLEDIFRVGFTHAGNARHALIKSVRQYWSSELGALITFLGSPLGNNLELFCRQVPHIADANAIDGATRPVGSLSDVAQIQTCADWINILFGALIANKLTNWQEIFETYPKTLNMDTELFTIKTLLCTALINADLNSKLSLAPITKTQLADFIQKHSQDTGRFEIEIYTLDDFTSKLLSSARETETVEVVINVIHSVLRLMQDEFKDFDPKDTQIDPRFIDLVLMEEA